MKYTYEINKQLTLDDNALVVFKARLQSGVYGELSAPLIDSTEESFKRYTAIKDERIAVRISDVTAEGHKLHITYEVLGVLSKHVPKKHKLAMRALVLNNTIKNILTFDIIPAE